MASSVSKLVPRCAAQHPFLLAFFLQLIIASETRADVVVLANRTRDEVPVRVVYGERQRSLVVPSFQQVVLTVRDSCQVLYDVSGELVRYQLDANSVYFFTLDEKGWLDLRRVDLGSNPKATAQPISKTTASAEMAELPVKILVDNHDPTPRSVWEKRLRGRVERVSKILQRHCRLKLKIVAVEVWDSGDKPIGFKQALTDFRRSVDPRPGRLAIGFTGRNPKETRQFDLGATQGMLQSHILIREWATSVSEPERIEVLLHEVGHYLGAVHSPDSSSVMRPILADDKAIRRSFHIGFDPVNTLILNLVSDDIRSHQADSVSMLTAETRKQLNQVYESLLKAVPQDKSIRQYLSQLNMTGGSRLTYATRLVVNEVRQSAQSRRLVARRVVSQPAADRLTDLYVRRAATVAARLPRDVAPSAFILGLGIAMDDSNTLLRNPITADFCRKVETDIERSARRRALGGPTLRGRRDLAQHFFLSAYLTAVVGAPAAESAGLAKELADARSSIGFSYRDLAADVAGIHFAQRLLDGQLSLADVARGFATIDLMPEVADLPEGVSWSEMGAQLKNRNGPNVTHYRTVIRHRVHQLSEDGESTLGMAQE